MPPTVPFAGLPLDPSELTAEIVTAAMDEVHPGVVVDRVRGHPERSAFVTPLDRSLDQLWGLLAVAQRAMANLERVATAVRDFDTGSLLERRGGG